jgi:integrase/recombinase XerC
VQQQAGHEHFSTTSLYTCVSSDFRMRTPRQALDQTLAAALDEHPEEPMKRQVSYNDS